MDLFLVVWQERVGATGWEWSRGVNTSRASAPRLDTICACAWELEVEIGIERVTAFQQGIQARLRVVWKDPNGAWI
jgi:hypothetical protein